MTQENLKRLQQAQLMIMDEIHRVCEKHQIAYYMIGGTLLGAVRHEGFIPWDIDIDIAMTRADYTRFKEVCEDELQEPFCYCDHLTDHDFNHPHALICLKGTKMRQRFSHLNPQIPAQPIYLDIFPLDDVPTSMRAQQKQAKKLRWLKKLKRLRVGYLFSRTPIKVLAKKLVRGLLFWAPVDKINAVEQKTMQKFSGSESGMLCSMASHYSYAKQCMPKEKYGTPVLLQFEDRAYYAPQEYIWYLERIYGDYMKIPPKEEQENNLAIFSEIDFGQIFDEAT